MPIYEYKCPQCNNVFEEWVKSHADTAPCPQCEAIASQIISNTTFVLKGGGWYVTEYGNRKNDTEPKGEQVSSSGEAKAPKKATADSTDASTATKAKKDATKPASAPKANDTANKPSVKASA